MEHFEPLFDEIICVELAQNQDKYTGSIKSSNPIGELRVELVRQYAKKNNLSLDNAVAYTDAVSDLALLEAVGFPVAVNPEVKLAHIAERRGWLVENFSKAAGYDSKLLPIAPYEKIQHVS